jgi:hypothetical protein
MYSPHFSNNVHFIARCIRWIRPAVFAYPLDPPPQAAEAIAKRLDASFMAMFKELPRDHMQFTEFMLTELERDNPHSSLYHMLVRVVCSLRSLR